MISVTQEGDFLVSDLSLASWGRDEIDLAASQMPGLMTLRKRYAPSQPLRGARIAGCTHVTKETAVLIETLIILGATVRWSSCQIFSTQDHVAAALAQAGVSVFAWKDQSESEYWHCMDQILSGSNQWSPNLLLDDGGHLTQRIHEHQPHLLKNIVGVTEQTTTGVARLHDMHKMHRLKIPAINVNDSVTKSKFDNLYGCRESLPDALKQATGMMIAGKTAVVCGYGDVGKGCAQALKSMGAQVWVTEIDPICALQASMEGYRVVRMDDVAGLADIFVTATGNQDVITYEHMKKMRDFTVLCNMGHADCEIDVASLESLKWKAIKSQVDQIHMPNGRRLILLAKGRLANLGCATGHPHFVMSSSFSNQVLAQMELFQNPSAYFVGVHRLSKRLDEEVARLHLDHVGACLTTLTPEQATYIGVARRGPFKVDYYRY